MRCLVRQHRPAREIANRKYMRHICSHLLVDLNDTVLVHVDARLVGIKLVAIRPTPNRDQYAIIDAYCGCVLAFEGNLDTRRRRAHLRYLGRQHDRVVAFLDDLRERPQQILVRARHQGIQQFHDADVDTQRRVNTGHFQTDDAAANNKQALGQRINFQRTR